MECNPTGNRYALLRTYTQSAMGEMLLGTPLIWSAGGMIHLSLDILTNETLNPDPATWTQPGDPVELSVPLPGSKLFFRFGAQ